MKRQPTGQITMSELSPELYEDIKRAYREDTLDTHVPDITIKGRTLVNILGRQGNAIYSQLCFSDDNMEVATDRDTYVATNKVGQQWYVRSNISVSTISGKYYIGIAEIKCASGRSYFRPNAPLDGTVEYKGTEDFDIYLCKFIANKDTKYMEIGHDNVDDRPTISQNDKLYFKNLRVYEITQEEYEAYDICDENVRCELGKKYPYVDDVKCVVNPYIESKDNLLDDRLFIQGFWNANSSKYEPLSTSEYSSIDLGNIHGTFSLRIEKFIAGTRYYIQEVINNSIINHEITTNDTTITIDEKSTNVFITAGSTIEAAQSIVKDFFTNPKNMVFVKGDSKSYDECHNSRIMFETKLYEGETISRRNDGTYVKNGEYEEKSLDLVTNFKKWNSANGNGYHIIGLYLNGVRLMDSSQILVRYDGKIFKNDIEVLNHWTDKMWVEGFYINPDDAQDGVNKEPSLVVTIPNELSGWGSSYSPTEAEIRAFFLGWRMTPDNGDFLYNDSTGVTTKSWVKLWCGIGEKMPQPNGLAPYIKDSSTWVVKCPTEINDRGYTPYRLIYKKATSTIEGVKTHGSLVVKDGVDTNIGSGLVLGDKVRPFYYKNSNYVGAVDGDRRRNVSHRVKKVLKVFDVDGNILNHSNIGRATAQGYIIGGSDQASYTTLINNDLSDYLIYDADTVSSFISKITPRQYTKEIIEKTIEELSNVNEKFSTENRALHNKIDSLPEVSNPNLLINGDFRINQRGNSVYEFTSGSTATYSVDRWITHRLSTDKNRITVLDRGIQLESLVSGAGVRLRQKLDEDLTKKLIGKTLTLSAKILSDCTNVFFNVFSGSSTTIFSKDNPNVNAGDIITYTFKVPTNVTRLEVQIGTTNPNVCIVEYMKLELGEHATPFVPRLYVEELTLCRQYFQIISGPTTRNSLYTNSSKIAHFYYIFDKMRKSPTVNLVGNLNSTNGIYVGMANGGNIQTGFTFSFSSITDYSVRINATNSTLASLDNYVLVFGGSSYLKLDAEIY